MDLGDLAIEYEQDQLDRERELRVLLNVAEVSDESTQCTLARALVVLLYSHLEGSARFAFSAYIRYVNSAGIECGHAVPAVAALTIADALAALRDPQRKCDELRADYPDDAKLHLMARERAFVGCLPDFFRKRVLIPEKVIDLEQNLKPTVLRKLLYKVGLDHNLLSEADGILFRVLEYRNRIAHGDLKAKLTLDDYRALHHPALGVMSVIKAALRRSASNRAYCLVQR